MGTYRLTEDAKSDLKRIYTRGLQEYGEAHADSYYNAFFDRFEQLAEQPLSYPAVDDSAPATDAACAALTASITAFTVKP